MTYRQLGNQRRCRRRSGSAGLPPRVPFALLVLSCACVHTSARAHTQEHQAGENTRGCETQEGERDERKQHRLRHRQKVGRSQSASRCASARPCSLPSFFGRATAQRNCNYLSQEPRGKSQYVLLASGHALNAFHLPHFEKEQAHYLKRTRSHRRHTRRTRR